MSILKIENSTLVFDSGEEILRIPEFSISKGDSVFLSGMNGTGKSTFFRALIGFSGLNEDRYASLCSKEGFINLGNIVENTNEKVIFIPQDEYLTLPFRTVEDVLAEGFAFMPKIKMAYVEKWIETYKPFKKTELSEKFLKSRISKLSGGQKKYLQLIQSLERCDSPKVELIIIDEPVNHLDAEHIAMFSNLLLNIKGKNPHIAFLISSHCHAFPFINKSYEIKEKKLLPCFYQTYNCFGSCDECGRYLLS